MLKKVNPLEIQGIFRIFVVILDTKPKIKLIQMIATVKYQIATYSGEIEVNCDESDDNEDIIAKAKNILRRRAGGSLPFGYESWKVVDCY